MDSQEQLVPLVKSVNVGEEGENPQVPGDLEVAEFDITGGDGYPDGEEGSPIKKVKQEHQEIVTHENIIDEATGKEKAGKRGIQWKVEGGKGTNKPWLIPGPWRMDNGEVDNGSCDVHFPFSIFPKSRPQILLYHSHSGTLKF